MESRLTVEERIDSVHVDERIYHFIDRPGEEFGLSKPVWTECRNRTISMFDAKTDNNHTRIIINTTLVRLMNYKPTLTGKQTIKEAIKHITSEIKDVTMKFATFTEELSPIEALTLCASMLISSQGTNNNHEKIIKAFLEEKRKKNTESAVLVTIENVEMDSRGEIIEEQQQQQQPKKKRDPRSLKRTHERTPEFVAIPPSNVVINISEDEEDDDDEKVTSPPPPDDDRGYVPAEGFVPEPNKVGFTFTKQLKATLATDDKTHYRRSEQLTHLVKYMPLNELAKILFKKSVSPAQGVLIQRDREQKINAMKFVVTTGNVHTLYKIIEGLTSLGYHELVIAITNSYFKGSSTSKKRERHPPRRVENDATTTTTILQPPVNTLPLPPTITTTATVHPPPPPPPPPPIATTTDKARSTTDRRKSSSRKNNKTPPPPPVERVEPEEEEEETNDSSSDENSSSSSSGSSSSSSSSSSDEEEEEEQQPPPPVLPHPPSPPLQSRLSDDEEETTTPTVEEQQRRPLPSPRREKQPPLPLEEEQILPPLPPNSPPSEEPSPKEVTTTTTPNSRSGTPLLDEIPYEDDDPTKTTTSKIPITTPMRSFYTGMYQYYAHDQYDTTKKRRLSSSSSSTPPRRYSNSRPNTPTASPRRRSKDTPTKPYSRKRSLSSSPLPDIDLLVPDPPKRKTPFSIIYPRDKDFPVKGSAVALTESEEDEVLNGDVGDDDTTTTIMEKEETLSDSSEEQQQPPPSPPRDALSHLEEMMNNNNWVEDVNAVANIPMTPAQVCPRTPTNVDKVFPPQDMDEFLSSMVIDREISFMQDGEDDFSFLDCDTNASEGEIKKRSKSISKDKNPSPLRRFTPTYRIPRGDNSITEYCPSLSEMDFPPTSDPLQLEEEEESPRQTDVPPPPPSPPPPPPQDIMRDFVETGNTTTTNNTVISSLSQVSGLIDDVLQHGSGSSPITFSIDPQHRTLLSTLLTQPGEIKTPPLSMIRQAFSASGNMTPYHYPPPVAPPAPPMITDSTSVEDGMAILDGKMNHILNLMKSSEGGGAIPSTSKSPPFFISRPVPPPLPETDDNLENFEVPLVSKFSGQVNTFCAERSILIFKICSDNTYTLKNFKILEDNKSGKIHECYKLIIPYYDRLVANTLTQEDFHIFMGLRANLDKQVFLRKEGMIKRLNETSAICNSYLKMSINCLCRFCFLNPISCHYFDRKLKTEIYEMCTVCATHYGIEYTEFVLRGVCYSKSNHKNMLKKKQMSNTQGSFKNHKPVNKVPINEDPFSSEQPLPMTLLGGEDEDEEDKNESNV